MTYIACIALSHNQTSAEPNSSIIINKIGNVCNSARLHFMQSSAEQA